MVARPARASGPRVDGANRVPRSAGFKILIPGYPQWSWRQPERALVLFGSFLAALGVGGFVWGTWVSLAILVFASATHVASAADVIRQASFPGFGRWVPLVSASAGLGLGCYVPALALALVYAWPGFCGDRASEGYLINRWAYRSTAPTTGDRAWWDGPGGEGARVVRVLAGPGQEVEWSKSGLRVDGQGVAWQPAAPSWMPRELSLTVPPGLVLIDPSGTGRSLTSGRAACGLRLVAQAEIKGRAWAKVYPIWERSLLQD